MKNRGLFCLISVIILMGCRSANQGSKLSIIGGREASVGDLATKHTVALVSIVSGQEFCSGSLIEQDVVLTAAHCMVMVKDPFVVVFSNDLRKTETITREQIRLPVAKAVHKGFSPMVESPTVMNMLKLFQIPPSDIAVILLNSEAPAGYSPVQLADSSMDETKITQVTAAGFGITKMDPQRAFLKMKQKQAEEYLRNLPEDEEALFQDPVTLREEFEKRLKPTAEEKKALEKSIKEFKPENNVLRLVDLTFKHGEYAGEFNVHSAEAKAVCSGDSGGPTYVAQPANPNAPASLQLLGVASRSDCETMAYYTDVRNFIEWINEAKVEMRAALQKTEKPDPDQVAGGALENGRVVAH